MAAARRSFIDRSTDTYLDELAKYGLDAPPEVIANGLRANIANLAASLGITEQSARVYFSEEMVRDLARDAAVELADEQPGADLWSASRNIPVASRTLGRSIAALAEAARARLAGADPTGPDKALQLISLLANFLSQVPDDQEGSALVALPQAALTRTARFLEATALTARTTELVTPDLPPSSARELADAFGRDAKVLRDLVTEHGLPEGPLTPG